MQKILLNYNSQTVGNLSLLDYVPVYGSPVRADDFYVLYTLNLNNIKIAGTYSDEFLIYEKFLFVTELFVEKTDDGFGIFKGSSLNKIDLTNMKSQKISSIKGGYVYPLRIENNKIIYTKTNLNLSIKKEFEQELFPDNSSL